MAVLVETSAWTTEGALESEGVDQAESFPDHHSGSTVFGLLDIEITSVEVKGVKPLVEQEREDLLSQPNFVVFVLTSVHEQVLVS